MALTPYHWNEQDKEALENARTYTELFAVAKGVIERMREPVGQVCGPISTGGSGDMAENIARLSDAILVLEKRGVEIFNQVPFQLRMKKIRDAKGEHGYDQSLLEEFYLPIFEAGLVQQLYFLPDWETSVGSRWEHEQGARLGMKITHL